MSPEQPQTAGAEAGAGEQTPDSNNISWESEFAARVFGTCDGDTIREIAKGDAKNVKPPNTLARAAGVVRWPCRIWMAANYRWQTWRRAKLTSKIFTRFSS
jgi:hypothetical protein